MGKEIELKLPLAVLYDPNLTDIELRVFMVVMSFAQQVGVCKVSQETIARLSQIKDQQEVSRVLQRLEKKNFLKGVQSNICQIVSPCERYPFLNDLDDSDADEVSKKAVIDLSFLSPAGKAGDPLLTRIY